MFETFTESRIDVGDTSIFVRRGGDGPPLLLLHGFPETHLMWHRVAPELARSFSVVCADLRGYGASGAPPSTSDHQPYSKRALAGDMVRVMDALGFPRFGIVGHDRGGRVAYRAALDHPERIERIAVLDIIPTDDAFARADTRFALAFWVWSFLAQPSPLPERLVGAAPDAIVDAALSTWGSNRSAFPDEVRAAYIDALRNPASVHAICEEYRAAATLDRDHDRADLAANRRIACPLLVLWSDNGGLAEWYSHEGGPLTIWRSRAADVRGRAVRGGHFFPEESPAETLSELTAFFACPQ